MFLPMRQFRVNHTKTCGCTMKGPCATHVTDYGATKYKMTIKRWDSIEPEESQRSFLDGLKRDPNSHEHTKYYLKK